MPEILLFDIDVMLSQGNRLLIRQKRSIIAAWRKGVAVVISPIATGQRAQNLDVVIMIADRAGKRRALTFGSSGGGVSPPGNMGTIPAGNMVEV